MVTKGDWAVEFGLFYSKSGGLYGITVSGKNIGIVYTKAYANLIVSAVNACKEINPDNPQAVAESIEDLVEALEYIIRELDRANIIKANSIFMDMPNKALAKVRRKTKK